MSEREKHANTLALTLPTSKLFYLFRDKNYTIFLFVCLKTWRTPPKDSLLQDSNLYIFLGQKGYVYSAYAKAHKPASPSWTHSLKKHYFAITIWKIHFVTSHANEKV